MSLDIDAINDELRGKDPLDIVRWAVNHSDEIICSTNFRPQEAVILHMATQVKPDIPILWADGGYATPETYRFAEKLIEEMKAIHSKRITGICLDSGWSIHRLGRPLRTRQIRREH